MFDFLKKLFGIKKLRIYHFESTEQNLIGTEFRHIVVPAYSEKEAWQKARNITYFHENLTVTCYHDIDDFTIHRFHTVANSNHEKPPLTGDLFA